MPRDKKSLQAVGVSTSASGDAGGDFETQVAAAFVAVMLAGGGPPCHRDCRISSLKLQARSGAGVTGAPAEVATDDLVITSESVRDGKLHRLFCNVKISVSFTASDRRYGEMVAAAWEDFKNPEVFKRAIDAFAFVTGPLSKADNVQVRPIFDKAREHETAEAFFREVEYESGTRLKKLDAFRAHLVLANGGEEVDRETEYQLLRHIHVLSLDLDIAGSMVGSLARSLIKRISSNRDPDLVWNRLYTAVTAAKKAGGTMSKDNLAVDLKKLFDGVYTSIPAELAPASSVSLPTWLEGEKGAFMAVALLAGSWSDENETDRSFVEKLAEQPYENWIETGYDLIHAAEDSPLQHVGPIWSIPNREALWAEGAFRIRGPLLSRFDTNVSEVLGEVHPQFGLPPNERHLASIREIDLQYSTNLRDGLATTVALLGCEPQALTGIEGQVVVRTAEKTVSDLLSLTGWDAWASLDDFQPLFAEAAPEVFLARVEERIIRDRAVFGSLLTEEPGFIFGGHHGSNLLRALEILAWKPSYLGSVCAILGQLAAVDPGGQYSNRPLNSLRDILLPWHQQTLAEFGDQVAVLQRLRRDLPDLAWELVKGLLPGNRAVTTGTRRPKYRQWLPEDWEPSITRGEYGERLATLVGVVLEWAQDNPEYLLELVGDVGAVPESAARKILNALKSESLTSLSEAQRAPVWEGLRQLIARHRSLPQATWAFPEEVLSELEGVAEEISPEDLTLRFRSLFGSGAEDLFGRLGDWRKAQDDLVEAQKNSVREILESSGVNGLLDFAFSVENPRQVGIATGMVADSEIDDALLPSLLDTEDAERRVVGLGFVWGRFRGSGWEWVDSFSFDGWTVVAIARFFGELPFETETWNRIASVSSDAEQYYWAEVSVRPSQLGRSLDRAVEKFLQADRAWDALTLISFRDKDEELNSGLAIEALQSAASTEKDTGFVGAYELQRLISDLQEVPDVDQDALAGIEWVYLSVLRDPHGGRPKILENSMSTSPDFFCELVETAFRARGKPQEKEPTDSEVRKAENAYHLLREWSIPPGLDDEGNVSEEALRTWVDKMEARCKESRRLELARQHLGQVLMYAPADPDGLWIHRAYASLLNEFDKEDVRRGLEMAFFNSRGFHAVDPTGAAEIALAERYENMAEQSEEAGYERLAESLRSIGRSYRHQADRIRREHEAD